MSYDRIAVINGLRGFAILAVVYYHAFAVWLTPAGLGPLEIGELTWYPYAALSNGWLGVNLFFVLSGFVLFAPYHANLRSMDSVGDVKTFYRKRASRLLPLYFLASIIGFLFMLESEQRTLSRFVHMITLTFPFTKKTFFPAYNFTLWSIGVEIWMSIAFPLLVIGYKRIGIWKLFGVTAVLSTGVRIFGTDPGFYGLGVIHNFVKDSFLGRLDDLVLGMAIVCVFHRYRDERVPGWWLGLGLVGGTILVLLTSSVWDGIRLGRVSNDLAPFTNTLFQAGCFLAVSALLLARNSIVDFVFGNRVIQVLGMMCYSVYVWHIYVIPRFYMASSTGILSMAVTLGMLSALTYRYVEFGHVASARRLFAPARPPDAPRRAVS